MLKKGYEQHYDGLDLAQLIAWLRLSGWDAGIFRGMFPELLPKLAGAPADMKEELYWGLRQIWANYYHIGERWDLPFFLAMVLCEMEYYPEALEYLQRSLALYGTDAITCYNMGLCHYRLRQLPAAQERLNEALALDATCEAARSLRIKIEAEQRRETTDG
jgi:tetratricopeptide (TPR) repeat protein